MKWFLAILAVAIGGAAGWLLSQRKRKREIMLNKIHNMCDIIINNLQFSRDSIEIILKKAGGDSAELQKLCAVYLGEREDETLQRQALKDLAVGWGLGAAEAESTAELFGALGKSDAGSQMQTVAHYQKIFDGYRAEAHEEWRKSGALYWKLGLLIGTGVAILIL